MASTPATPYRFTPEELRVLQECNRESLYKRCLPLSTILGAGTYMAVKAGVLQPSAKYGAIPKLIGASIIGYFIGKISYQTTCAEKMMSVPDSKIGALLRSRRFGSQQDVLGMNDQELEKAISSMPESEKYTDISQRNQLDMDMDRPLISGLEDYKPNIMDDVKIQDDSFIPSRAYQTTSYEELRKRNREEFEQKRTKSYRGIITPEEVPSGPKVQERSPLDTKPTAPLNIYGDVWEK